MTRKPVILAGLCVALLAAPAWAQGDFSGYAATLPDSAASGGQPPANAPAAMPDSKGNPVKVDRLRSQHLAEQQKAIAAQRQKIAEQQKQLSAEQQKLAAEQRKLAAEQRMLASGGRPVGCGNFLGQPRSPETCRALHQQAAVNRLGPYDKPAAPTGQ